ncbi:MAG: hypothetical protein ABI588_09505 [Arenimonas sp.]
MAPIDSCHGALALELAPGTVAERAVLDQQAAGELAALVARDLSRFDDRSAELDLGLLGAAFDPVELLRPGWPLHRELERLVAQAPGAGLPRVIVFADRDGRLPENLQPHPDFGGGALRLVPWILRGPRDQLEPVAAGFEGTQPGSGLLETGMAGADTALCAQAVFGARVEHARYLTVHDLAALIAMQYDNVGLGAAWPLIETALLAPGEDYWLDAPPEPLVRYAGGEARIALFDDESWPASGLAPTGERDAARMGRDFDRFQMRQRQLAALFEAHGIASVFEHCPVGKDARAVLRA